MGSKDVRGFPSVEGWAGRVQQSEEGYWLVCLDQLARDLEGDEAGRGVAQEVVGSVGLSRANLAPTRGGEIANGPRSLLSADVAADPHADQGLLVRGMTDEVTVADRAGGISMEADK
jgi:hypothetical protein